MTDDPVAPRILDEVRLTPLDRMTISNMERSSRDVVAVTVMHEARAEALLAWRDSHRDAGIETVSVTSLLAYVMSRTLAQHPDVNAAVLEDRKVRFRDVGLGLAVATPSGGLTVPVIQRAQERTLEELATEVRRLSEVARHGRLAPADVRGGTFTLSSIGMVMPGGMGTAIIPRGQAGVLVVGGVRTSACVEGDRVVPGRVLPLSLTFDHRVANGVALWTFFAALISRIETAGTIGGDSCDT